MIISFALVSLASCKKEDSEKSDKTEKAEKAEKAGCEYLSAKEAEKAAGHALKNVKGETCAWESTDDEEPRSIGVTVSDYTKDLWESLCSKGKAVEDLGDKAVNNAGSVCVKKGKKLITVNAAVADADKNAKAAESLAKKVVGKVD